MSEAQNSKGYPKRLPCLGPCGKLRRATWAGDRVCDECNKFLSKIDEAHLLLTFQNHPHIQHNPKGES